MNRLPTTFKVFDMLICKVFDQPTDLGGALEGNPSPYMPKQFINVYISGFSQDQIDWPGVKIKNFEILDWWHGWDWLSCTDTNS